ncbi:MAG TPA: hypothetical protein H9799_10315 [Candidatus Mediterraneibacter merdipullorum]|nr:hypothetical protein [Candidatus Mediterraneibacter merdipullorum]
MKNSNSGALKACGLIMLIFGIVYVLVGTMALAGIISNVLPGHEAQEVIIIVLAYAIALLGIVCGIVCMKGITGAAKVCGIIFAGIGLASLIYQQVVYDTFALVDSLAMCYGIAIFSIASKVEKEN